MSLGRGGNGARREGFKLLALAGVVTLFFAPALALRGVFFDGDVTNYAPRLAWTGEWLRAGRLPLWDPLLSLGGPHAADLAQVFYPPHLLFSLLLGDKLYNYDVAFHVLLAALGTYALAREWSLSGAAALLAAFAYALSGFSFGHLQHLNVVVALAWIPLVQLAAERYLVSLEPRALGHSMLATGMLMLGGHPQLVAYGLAGVTLLWAFRLAGLEPSLGAARRARQALGLLGMLLGGLALAALFLLPFAQWMQFVSRTDRVSSAFATSYSLPPARLVGFVAPFWLGGSLERPHETDALIELSCYLGALPFALAPVSLAWRSGRVFFLLVLALGALVLSLGAHTAFYEPVLALPVLGWARAPARFLALAVLALALLAGFGLDALRAGRGRGLARAAALGLVVLAVLVARAASSAARLAPLFPLRPDRAGFDEGDTRVLLLTLVGAAGALWLLSRQASRLALLLALSFTVADLHAFQAQLGLNQLAPRWSFQAPSANGQAMREAGLEPRFFAYASNARLKTLLYTQGDYDSYRLLAREGLRGSLGMAFGLQALNGRGSEPVVHAELMSAIVKRFRFDSRSARLAGVFGVRYIVSDREMTAPELTLVRRGALDLYRNEAAVPRVQLVPESRRARDDRAAFALVKRPEFEPRRTVILEVESPPMPDAPLAGARAAIVAEEPDLVLVETRTSRPAWLVLNDTYAPGWRAHVDGRPAALLRANGLVRAVAVGAGRHLVEFSYLPRTVLVGAGISLLGLLVVGALVFAPGRRSK